MSLKESLLADSTNRSDKRPVSSGTLLEAIAISDQDLSSGTSNISFDAAKSKSQVVRRDATRLGNNVPPKKRAPHLMKCSKCAFIPLWAWICTLIWCSVIGACLKLYSVQLNLGVLQLAAGRIKDAALTVPTVDGWIALSVGLVGQAVLLVPFGIKTKMLTWPPTRDKPWMWPRRGRPLDTVTFAFVKCLVTPGLAEELVFRVLPLPGASETVQWDVLTSMVFLGCLLIFAFPYVPPCRPAHALQDTLALGIMLTRCITWVRSPCLRTGGFSSWPWCWVSRAHVITRAIKHTSYNSSVCRDQVYISSAAPGGSQPRRTQCPCGHGYAS
jgi:hypothetical protein